MSTADEFGFVAKVGQEGTRKSKPTNTGIKPAPTSALLSSSPRTPDIILTGINDNKSNTGGMLKHARTGSNSSSRSRSPVPHLENGSTVTQEEQDTTPSLPQRFVVKYMGYRETSNLWGIKYTRRPVDEMVGEAKRLLSTSTGKSLPLLKLEVTEDGIIVGPMPQNTNPVFPNGKFAIESISYGVQDLVYTRVFAMIVVKAESAAVKLSDLSKLGDQNAAGTTTTLPFRCHAFVTDTRETARNLTYALAAAFQKFSQKVSAGKVSISRPKRFAIDLRAPEEIEAEMLDSEA